MEFDVSKRLSLRRGTSADVRPITASTLAVISAGTVVNGMVRLSSSTAARSGRTRKRPDMKSPPIDTT